VHLRAQASRDVYRQQSTGDSLSFLKYVAGADSSRRQTVTSAGVHQAALSQSQFATQGQPVDYVEKGQMILVDDAASRGL